MLLTWIFYYVHINKIIIKVELNYAFLFYNLFLEESY